MPTSTLTSLAILKSNIDRNGHYLDYLHPFVLQVLLDHKPTRVTAHDIATLILTEFGLVIPEPTIQLVLKKMSRQRFLTKENRIYQITNKLLTEKQSMRWEQAKALIDSVVGDFESFSQQHRYPLVSPPEEAICAFLNEFDIICIKAYLRNTTIPSLEDMHDTDVVLVGKYVLHVQEFDAEAFDNFMVMVQGHMLANALLCPDLANAPKHYRQVTFYLDTPILLDALGLESDGRLDAISELLRLLRDLGGTTSVLSHTRDELVNVINATANALNAPGGRGIVLQARRRGMTKSDLILVAEDINRILRSLDIKLERTPKYVHELQIDEASFEKFLDDEVSYWNPRARDNDINSVRSVFVLRGRKNRARRLENAKAVLVTSNSAFARAAWTYGKETAPAVEVSSVITDNSLANMAWLKAPMKAPLLPRRQVIAYSYVLLQPSRTMLESYLQEIEKLEQKGDIRPEQHQILRSNPVAYDELMDLTLGDDTLLTEATIGEVLQRIEREIKEEESEKYLAEKRAHERTKADMADASASMAQDLHLSLEREESVKRKLRDQCEQTASKGAWIISATTGTIMASLFLTSLAVQQVVPVVVTIGLMNVLFGFTVLKLHGFLKRKIYVWLLKRREKALDLEIGE